MAKFKDMAGMKVGRWTVLSPRPAPRCMKWLCVCECGNTSVIEGKTLRAERSLSCGCLKREKLSTAMKTRATTHGLSQSRTYGIWAAMKARCSNPKTISYKHYGAKGVKVCSRWHSFEHFLEDMGECPDGYSIERLDNSIGYSPDNCVWIPRTQQNTNKSNNCLITANGETRLMSDWARVLNIDIRTLWARYQAGWSHHDIVNRAKRGATPDFQGHPTRDT